MRLVRLHKKTRRMCTLTGWQMKISEEDACKGKFMTRIFVCGDIMTNELKGNMEERA